MLPQKKDLQKLYHKKGTSNNIISITKADLIKAYSSLDLHTRNHHQSPKNRTAVILRVVVDYLYDVDIVAVSQWTVVTVLLPVLLPVHLPLHLPVHLPLRLPLLLLHRHLLLLHHHHLLLFLSRPPKID